MLPLPLCEAAALPCIVHLPWRLLRAHAGGVAGDRDLAHIYPGLHRAIHCCLLSYLSEAPECMSTKKPYGYAHPHRMLIVCSYINDNMEIMYQ